MIRKLFALFRRRGTAVQPVARPAWLEAIGVIAAWTPPEGTDFVFSFRASDRSIRVAINHGIAYSNGQLLVEGKPAESIIATLDEIARKVIEGHERLCRSAGHVVSRPADPIEAKLAEAEFTFLKGIGVQP